MLSEIAQGVRGLKEIAVYGPGQAVKIYRALPRDDQDRLVRDVLGSPPPRDRRAVLFGIAALTTILWLAFKR